jgi:predicted phosphodiesterase
MRIAVVSDIHGNKRALEAVLADLREVAPDLVVHGGDLVANGAHPADVIDQVRSLGWRGVYGNTDEMLWCPERLLEVTRTHLKLAEIVAVFKEMIPATAEAVGEERLRWLAALPPVYTIEDLTVIHASPGDIWRAPLPSASDSELEKTYAALPCGIIVYAHIHRPHVRHLSNRVVANTGSLSLSYDGDPRASYLVVDGHSVSIRRVKYDVESEAKELLNCGLPHAAWLSRILLSGQYCPPA